MTARLPRLRWRQGAGRPGQAMVEFALTGMIFFLTVLGMAEGGRVIYAYARMAHAIQEGGRAAALPKETTVNDSAVRVKVASIAGGVTISPITVTVPGGSFPNRKEGDRVIVSGRHTFVPIVTLIFGGRATIPLSYQTEFTVEYST